MTAGINRIKHLRKQNDIRRTHKRKFDTHRLR